MDFDFKHISGSGANYFPIILQSSTTHIQGTNQDCIGVNFATTDQLDILTGYNTSAPSSTTGIDNLDGEYQLTRPTAGTIVARASKTITNASTDFLPATLNTATTHVLWQVLGSDIKVELDGTTASATVVVLLKK